MKLIPWWFVGCAVLTIAVGLTLTHFFDSAASVAVCAAAWGALIGSEIRRRRAEASESASEHPRRGFTHQVHEAVRALIFTLGLVAVAFFAAAYTSPSHGVTKATPTLATFAAVLFGSFVVILVLSRRRMASRERSREVEPSELDAPTS